MKLIMENWNTFVNEEEVLNEKIDRDAIIKAASKLLDKVPNLSKVIEKAVSQSPEMQELAAKAQQQASAMQEIERPEYDHDFAKKAGAVAVAPFAAGLLAGIPYEMIRSMGEFAMRNTMITSALNMQDVLHAINAFIGTSLSTGIVMMLGVLVYMVVTKPPDYNR
jgi:hypothetical protein